MATTIVSGGSDLCSILCSASPAIACLAHLHQWGGRGKLTTAVLSIRNTAGKDAFVWWKARGDTFSLIVTLAMSRRQRARYSGALFIALCVLATGGGTLLSLPAQALALAAALAFIAFTVASPALVRFRWSRLVAFPGATTTIFLLAAFSVDLILWSDGSRSLSDLERSPLSSSNVLRAVFLVLALVSAFIRRPSGPESPRNQLGWLPTLFMLYSVSAMLSATYASSMVISLVKAMELAVSYAIIFVVAHRVSAGNGAVAVQNVARLWRLILFYLTVRVLVYWASALSAPATAFAVRDSLLPYQFTGSSVYGALHPNTVGEIGAILAVVGLSRMFGRLGMSARIQAIWLMMLTLGTVTLAFAQARTSLVALAVAVPVLLLLFRRLLSAIVLSSGLAALFIAYGSQLWDYFRRGQELSALSTLTGRTEFWKIGLEMFRDAPLVGHGYYTGVRFGVAQAMPEHALYDIANLDNTFLEVLVNNGAVGGLPFFVGYTLLAIVMMRGARAARRVEWALPSELMGVFVVVAFRAVLGPTFQVFHINLLFLLVFAASVGLGRVQVRDCNPSRSQSGRYVNRGQGVEE